LSETRYVEMACGSFHVYVLRPPLIDEP